MSASAFRFGDWTVEPATNSVQRDGEQRQMEPRAMDVLVALAARSGEVVTADELLTTCWGSNIGGDNPVHKTIAQLRKVLGDSSSAPCYIETIRKRGYRTVAELARTDAALDASWLDETPFRGLAPFEERHSAVFFGRSDATDAVLRAIARQSAAGCAMVLVLGPSGSGKTSLIRAGVLARLAGGSPHNAARIGASLALDCADLEHGALLQGLASVLLDADAGPGGPPLFEQDSADSLARRLAHEPDGVIATLAEGARRYGARTALFIDRFEALLRDPEVENAERAAVIALLLRLANSGAVLLLLACRNDFYPQLASHPALMALKDSGGHVDLAPPSSAEIAQMVRQPARAAGLRFGARASDGAALDDELCAAARSGPDTLPLLQYCLEELYRQRDPGGELRFEVYQALGGIEGAIGARAEQVLTRLDADQKAALPQVLDLLVHVAEDELAVTARPAPWSALPGPAAEALVKALVEARLFSSSLQADTPVFAIAHEALLRRWPRVVEWVDRHRQALQVRTRIAAQAARWDGHGRSRDLLLPPGLQARQARELRDDGALGLRSDAVATAYIDASLRRVRRGERARLAVLGVVLLLALLAVLLSITARRAQRDAEQHRTEAEELMGFMLGDFVERLRPLGRLDLLDSVSARALVYLADDSHDATGASLAQRAKALQVLSEVKMARGDGAGAESALLLGRAILQRQLAAAPLDTALLKSAGANAFWLGQLHYDRSDWAGARVYFTQYRQFADRQAASAPQDPDGKIEQSYAHNSLGSVELKSGAVAAAAREFDVSTALKSAVLADKPDNDKLAADLANSLSWQASARAKLGELARASGLYEREAAIMGRLHHAAPGNGAWTKRYAFARHHLGELQQASGQQAAARASFAQAAALLKQALQDDPRNLDLQGHLQAAELSALAAAEDSEVAATAWPALVQRLEDAVAREPAKPKLARVAALGRLRWAQLETRRGHADAAAAVLAPALERLAHLHASTPTEQSVTETYSQALLSQAQLVHNIAEMHMFCRKAQTLLSPSAEGSMDFVLLAPLVQAGICSDEESSVRRDLMLLEKMQYQERHFVDFLSAHRSKKGPH
ncbi:MAG: winged helix-turn-helix domain-containing protein [Massilia sp.]